MHIGFDISQTGRGKTGCGYFTHAMLEALLTIAPEHHYSLYSSFGDLYFDPMMWLRSPYSGSNISYGPRHISIENARKFWTHTNLSIALKQPDIIQANNFWCPTQQMSSRIIYTCHDLNFTVSSNWSTKTNMTNCFEGVFQSSIYADLIIAVSQATRSHYLKVFPHFPEDRIRVIYPCSRFTEDQLKGVRPAALSNISKKQYWLCVGTIEPRKNLLLLVRAYARYLALGGKPKPLILAGGKGWMMEEFESELFNLGLIDKVKMIGYVTDAELIWLYQNCYGNLYPSLFEGFGLPVLEGMQCGAPSIISSATSMPEVGGEAAIQLAPNDMEGWAQAMCSLSNNEAHRSSLSQKATEQAGQFDWKKSARALLGLYEEVQTLPKRNSIPDVKK